VSRIPQIIGAGGQVATASIPLFTAASTAAWAVPVVGAAVAGVTLAVSAFLNRKGPQQKRMTAQWADEAERLLVQNRDQFLASGSNEADRAAALQNFDDIFAELVSMCSDPAMGAPGQRCVSERQRGGQWDWYALYRDPIEQRALLSWALLPSGPQGETLLVVIGGFLLLVGIASMIGGGK
jgi:hypothetical protein